MSNELVPKTNAILAKPITGLVGYDESMLGSAIPEIRISGRENAGQWRLGRETYYKSLSVVLIATHPVRIYQEGPADRPKTVCASVLGRVPLATIEHPMARDCGSCALGQWQEGAGGKRVQPCMLCPALLFVIPAEDDRPFWYVPRKGAAGAAFRFLNELRMGTPGLQSFSQVQVTLTTEKKQNGPRSWYEPVFAGSHELLPIERYNDLTTAAVEHCRYTPRVDGTSASARAAEDGSIDVTPSDDSGVPF